MRPPPAVVATRFPFGLFVKMRDLPRPSEIIVYPHIHDVDPGAAAAALHGLDQVENDQRRSHTTARSGEFFGLREYREGDELRRIHWPAVARQGRPIVREHEDEGVRELVLGLARGTAGEREFEAEVEHVASLALALLGRGDVAVGLRYGGEVVVAPATGAGQRRELLEFLALVGLERAA